MVEYKYDAWGKSLSVRTLTTAYDALAQLNPFRYRGYVYDEETELYYLRSRYYNSVWDRFVIEDSRVGQKLLSSNLFCYCSNNPTSCLDPNGESWETWFSEFRKKLTAIQSAVDAIPDFEKNFKKSNRDLEYLREYMQTITLLVDIRESVSYNKKTGLLRIPNNTEAAQKLFQNATVPKSNFFFDYDWAEMMAYVGIDKFETENGYRFHTCLSKVTYEVRVHAQVYDAGFFKSHTDITDISEYEGKGWVPGTHPQWWIDLFYSLGAR